MKRGLKKKIREIKLNQFRSGYRRSFFTVVAAVVVFATVYALILPAVTLEQYYCGLEEHQHGVDCYIDGVLVCGQEEHMHTDACRKVVAEVQAAASRPSVFGFGYSIGFETIDGGEYTVLGGRSALLSQMLAEISDADREYAVTDITSLTLDGMDIDGDSFRSGNIEVNAQEDGDYLIQIIADDTEENISGESRNLAVHFSDSTVLELVITISGKPEAEDNGVTISAADGSYLPENAEAHAQILGEANAETAAEKVENSEIDLASGSEAETVKNDFDRYQVFDINLDGIDAENYTDGFHVDVQLPEDLTGRDFRLYHVHEGEELVDITDTLLLHFADDEALYAADPQVGNLQAADLQGEKLQEAMQESNPEELKTITGFSFSTENFSEFVLRYTVDFKYSVNGKMYQFSLPGGGFVSFTDLVEVLGIIDDTNAGENEDENGSVITENAEENAVEIVGTVDENATNEEAEENGVHSDTNTSLTLGDVEVSEASKKFVADVASVEFSNPELVDVSKVDADTTVGQIKESRGLEVEYSAELTEEQIAEINAQTVEARDWALISMQPFTSEETLTVTMKDGEVFTVQVTDAAYSGTIVPAEDLDGKTGALINRVRNNAVQSSVHSLGRLQAAAVNIDPASGTVTTTDSAIQLTEWTFTRVGESGNNYYIHSSAGYLNIGNNGVTVSDQPQSLRVDSNNNNQIRIRSGSYALNNWGSHTANGYGTWSGGGETGNNDEWFTVYTIEQIFPVTLHFVKEDGTSFAAGEVTYADGTPVAYADGNFKVDPSKVVVGNDGTVDLNQFIVKDRDYTLSNTHRKSWQDVLSGVSNPAHGANAQQPHSIIGNELKWVNGKLQYHAFYTNSDKAGSTWIDVGYRPAISDNNAAGHPGTPVADGILDYYLVYSPKPGASGSGSGGGNSGSGGNDLDEVGKSKTLTPNSDGTYTMDLSVTTHAKGDGDSNKINLIIVFDTSSSMRRSVNNANTQYGTNDFKNHDDSRFIQARNALNTFLTDLCPDDNATTNRVQLALIDFNYSASTHAFNGGYWTNSASSFINTLDGLSCPSGTNWAEALDTARTVAATADNDPTYVLLMTDGAPSQYWGPSEMSGLYVDGEGCYLGARDEARAVVNDGLALYGVFSFGDQTDEDNAYLSELVDYAYDANVRLDHSYYASNPQKLINALNSIFSVLKEKVAHTGVNYNDGIALDTTSTALSNVTGGSLGSITYSKTGGTGTPYTAVVDSTGKAIFQIGTKDPDTENPVDPTDITYTKIQGTGNGITTTSATAKVYQYTDSDGTVYTMPIATLAIDEDTKEGDLNWDLSSLGFLENNAEYKISFVVWPDQEAYDYVADLNNGKMQWNTGTQEAVYEADGTTVKYYKNGVAKYPNIVYNPNTNKYAALTNTKQEVTYYVGSESTGTSGEQSAYSGKYETHPVQPDPMPLEASLSKIEKKWNVDRDPKILAELLYGNKDKDGNWIPYSIRFGVHIDGKTEEYTSVTLGWETEWNPETNDYVWADEPWTTVPYGGKDHPIGKSWVKDFSIATGLMLSTERMNALGLDTNAYPKHFDYTDADGQTVTYYILEDGHDYTLEESPKMGYEFDFESPVFHPMLVDGKLQSVTFTHSEPDSDHPQGIITGIEEITDEENGINSLKVQNTLRGYINLKKIVVDEDDERLTEDQTKFSYRIELQNSDDVFEGDHIPWYGVNRLFYHDDSFNYYQAYVDDSNNLKICTESGGLENPYDAVVGTVDSATGEFTPGGTFDPNNVIGQTLKFNDGSGDRIVTIKGNRTEATDEKNAWAEMKISQNETLSVANVPHGTTYTIKEKDSVGYKLDKIETNQSDDTTISLNDSSIEGTIVPNTNNDVTFTNKVQRGNLKVTKKLLGDVTGNENMEFKVTIKNSAGQYLQTDGSFADTEHEFTVSVSEPFEITGIPVDTYTVAEKTAEGDIAIAGYLWNGTESTTSGTGAVQNSQTATVELKNYYDEIYTPVPSDTNKTTDLVIDKDWVKADGSTAPVAGDTIKFKVKVKSADAYIPVDWKLYNGNGQLNEEQSGIYYVQNGANVTFTFDRFEQLKSSPGTSYWLNTNVPLTTGSGNTISPRNIIPHTSSGSGAWNQESKTITFATAVNGRVHVLAQPYGSGAKWVTTPSANGERSWSTSVTGGDYYTNVEAMRDALIDENATVENLVYVLNSTGVTLDENDTTCNIRPASATADNWVATLAALPTYQLIEDEDGNQSYKVYSYEITEIEVNGQTVTNNRTDDYIVSTSTSGETTTITNTEIKKVSVDATKSWQNADGSTNAPIGAAVTFELFANDEATGKTVVLDGVTREAEINADETLNAEEKVAAIAALNQEESGEFTAWKAEWKNLPQYSDDTQSALITYVVKEVSGLAGYTNQNPNGVSTGGIITNKQDAVDFDILKVAAGTTNTLEGASFTIQPVKKNSNTMSPEYETGSSPSDPENTDAYGKASFTGITSGYYEVKETKTPDGYVITGDGTFYVKIDANGIKLLEKEVKDGKLSFKEATTTTVGNVTIDTQASTVTFTVENEPGAALPHTGGPGTRLFTVLGAVLTLGAGVLLWRRRRLI